MSETRYRRSREDTVITAVLIVLGFLGVLCTLAIVAACIIGPLTGHWEPDVGVGFWLVVAGLVYLVYLVLRHRDSTKGEP